MTSWKDHYQSDTLSGNDPRLQGQYMQLTVHQAALEETQKFGSEEMVYQVFLYFHETPERMKLSKQNCERMEQLTRTDDISRWAGQQITLYVESKNIGGAMRNVINIWVDPTQALRQAATAASQPPQQPAPQPSQPPPPPQGAAMGAAAQNLGQTTAPTGFQPPPPPAQAPQPQQQPPPGPSVADAYDDDDIPF